MWWLARSQRVRDTIGARTEVKAICALEEAHADVGSPAVILNADDKVAGRVEDSLHAWLGRVILGFREYCA